MHYKADPSGIPAEEVDFAALLAELQTFDSWALSTHTPSLRWILPMCPAGTRIGAWVKPFCPFRGQRIAYAWEPLLFFNPRNKKDKTQMTVRDWVSETPPVFERKNIGPTKGQKGRGFCFWMFDMMGLRECDELCDLFPGSGAVSHYFRLWLAEKPWICTANSPIGLKTDSKHRKEATR